MPTIKVFWKVEDGFMNNGLHTLEIDGYDAREYLSLEDEDEQQEFLDELVYEEFQNTVSFEVVDVEVDGDEDEDDDEF